MCIMRRKRRFQAARAVGAAAAAVVLGGCATKSDIRDLRTQLLAEMRAQSTRQDSLIAMLQRATSSTQDTLRTQTDQLFDFRGEITRLLQQITQGQARLEAIVGENQRGIASLRGQTAGGRTPIGPGPSTDTAAAPPTGPETVAGVGGGAEQLYALAREQQQRGSLNAAQRAYEQLLREYPNHPLAPDARYWLGTVLQELNRLEDAVDAFEEIPTRHPTAARVPDALFQIARLQIQLGRTDDARATLERIIGTYPESLNAGLAREMLEELP
jgi:tol-pal system protein YbgF